ncbi:MAG TPA: hypothetical protein DCM23_00790 [Firmicutes bacterium]|nr:hypothetical protein [Bacillota bacterium]
MGNDDLAIRFSNETYATRSDVIRALRTNLVDAIWTNIIKYRGQFTRLLSLHGIDHGQLTIVLTPSIVDATNTLERKLMKAWRKLDNVAKTSSAYALFEQQLIAEQLEAIAKKYRININEAFCKSIVNDSLSNIVPERMILVNYFAAIKYIKNNPNDPIDEAFFASLYTILSGQEDLKTLYREHEISSYEQKALINKTYVAAPINRIDEMMKELQEFIIHAEMSPLIKAIIALYFIMLIKPFETYSEEMALLTLKTILVHADFDEMPLLLMLEPLLIDQNDDLARTMNEVQKTGDVTYLIVALLPLIEAAVMRILDDSVVFEKETIIEEAHHDVIAEVPATISPQAEASVLPATTNKPLTIDERMALPSIPITLDEVDASRIEEHLMETNPALKRGEAYFYARHCTIGKFYTISQFKKTLGCAYETARTSMDHLAQLGYYRKEHYKNKFIYTPVGRK